MANILVIDDDVRVAGLLEAHLKDEGFDVKIARRGDEGVAAAGAAAPDLILLDVMLPDATGYQVCTRLRELPSIQNVPIIMMSGVARYANQKMYAMERGANDYLVKPFQILEVGELVHSYLSKDATHPAPKEEVPPAPVTPPVSAATPDQIDADKLVPPSPALDDEGLLELRTFLKNAIASKRKP